MALLLLGSVACSLDAERSPEPLQPWDEDGGTTTHGPGDPDDSADGATTFGEPPPTGGTAPGGSSEGSDDADDSRDADSGSSSDGSVEPDPCPRVRVDVPPGDVLNVRPDPSTANPPVGTLAGNTIVDVLGEVVGEPIGGVDLWYHIASPTVEGFVLSTFAMCTLDEAPKLDPNAFYLPLQCGTTAQVSQGNNGPVSHQGSDFYAFDLSVPLNTPLLAMRDGVVDYVFNGTQPGDPCYGGGGPECISAANQVNVLHADGTLTLYLHLNQVTVSVGDAVSVGTTVGLSGTTGYSTGRHAHVMRTGDCGGSYCASIEMMFSDVGGDGIPEGGDFVTSGNCP